MCLTLSKLFSIVLNVHLASPNFDIIDFSLQTLHLLYYRY
jgi:hypothetical protein